MTRASWGGTSGDLSGLFTSLQDTFQSRAAAAAQRQINRSKEEQAALDSDAYDRWTNGQMTDEEWLAYIQERVQQTEGDPQEHQQWVEAYRKHSQSIEDNQLEAQWNAGQISIHELIGHYADRMNGVESNSPEYRDLQSRYYDLIDRRDADYIESTSRAILARINRGKAGYGELLNFYKSMLGKIRKSSNLYQQVAGNIQSIQDIVDGVSGGRGGSGSGGGGSGSGSSDPNDAYSVASRAVLDLWNSGNVFQPGGPDLVQSVVDAYGITLNDDSDMWKAMTQDRVNMENALDRAIAHPEDQWITIPGTGQQIENTAENRFLITNQLERGYDFAIAYGEATGRDITSVQNKRAAIVPNYYNPQNDYNLQDAIQREQQTFWEDVTIANQQPDPDQALNSVIAAGARHERALHGLLGEKYNSSRLIEGTDANRQTTEWFSTTRLFPEEQLSDETQQSLRFTLKLSNFLKNAKTMTPEELISEGSILLDSRPEGYYIGATDLQDMIGSNLTVSSMNGFGTDTQFGTGVVGHAVAARGLQAARAVDSGQPTIGVEAYRMVSPGPGINPRAVPEDAINQFLGVDDWTDGYATIGGWEKVNGKTTWVVRPLVDVPEQTWWYNPSQHRWMDEKTYNGYGNDFKRMREQGWTSKPVTEMSGWKMVVDGSGTTWYRDPEDGFLYLRPPVQTGGPVFNYGRFVNSKGEIVMDRQASGTSSGFVAFFSDGVTSKEAQTLTDQIVNNPFDSRINLDNYHKREGNAPPGVEGLAPSDIVGMYWSPQDDSIFGELIQSRNFTSAQKQRQRRYAIHERADARRAADFDAWAQKNIGDFRAQMLFEKYNPDTSVEDFAAEQIRQGAQAAQISLGRMTPGLDQNRATGFQPPNPTQPYRPPLKPPTIAPVQIPIGPSEGNKVSTPPPLGQTGIPSPTNTSGSGGKQGTAKHWAEGA